MLEVYKKLPKESFELILRNFTVREYLKNAWNKFLLSGNLEPSSLEKIFDELFRFFLRPFELIIFNEKIVRSIFPIEKILVGEDVLSAYTEFVESFTSHMKLTFQLFSQPFFERMPVENFIEEWKKFFDKFEVKPVIPYDLPFALPENAKNYLIDCILHWKEFVIDYEKYRDLLRNSYMKSVEKFCEFLSKSKPNSFEEFRNSFMDFMAKEFDSLLISEEYLKLQQKLLDALFDHIYCLRRFLELLIENNPASPFATVSQIDEAYKRIMDLRRKVLELEKRIELLEGKYARKD
ncbi:MAG: poly(R)-hydroxyalkanoic acid synthase subunit PhaE [Archaeoglobaceae archaeon]